MSALPAPDRDLAASGPAAEWAQITPAAPQLAATMRRYLSQLATFLAPASVEVADLVLRQFACWLLAATSVTAVAAISCDDIEDFKVHLAARPGGAAGRLSASTYRQRLRTLRMFFERIIEWDWPDAPPRNPVIAGDIPKKPCWMRASGWRAPSAIGSAREPRCSTAAASRWARSASPKAAGT